MEEVYDFSHSMYSFNIYFNKEKLHGSRVDVLSLSNRVYKLGIQPSIIYDIASKKILKWGSDCVENSEEKSDVNMIYVENVFMELNNIYKRGDHTGIFKHDKDDDILLQAMEVFLRELVRKLYRDDSLIFATTRYHISLVVPTIWELGIRQKLIWPLFVRAGILGANDNKKRLLIFTELDALVQFVKRNSSPKQGRGYTVTPNFEIGKEYILYDLHFTPNHLWVNLDLFSIHWLIEKVTATDYIPRSLNSHSFSIPFNTKIQDSIQYCLQLRGFDIDSFKTKEILALLVDQYHKEEYFLPKRSIIDDTEEHIQMHIFRPFKSIGNQWGLSDTEIMSLQSITMYDIHADLLNNIRKKLSSNLKDLLNGVVSKERLTIRRVTWSYSIRKENYNSKIKNGLEARIVHGWLLTLLENCCEYQTSNSMDGVVYTPYYLNDNGDINIGHIDLMKTVLHLSIINKSPTIIDRGITQSTEIASMSRFRTSEPDSIIYINLSFKGINVSYSNKFYNDITIPESTFHVQPLFSYFIQMEMYQRPILFVTNRMKVYMDSKFKDFLKLFPKHNNRRPRKKNVKKNKKITGSKTKRYNQVHYICNKVKIFRESSLDPQPITYRPMMDALKDVGLKIKDCISSYELQELFEKPNTSEPCVFIDQKKYTRLFLMMYLGYLHGKITRSRLQENPKASSSSELNTGYFISVEKPLMDNVCGSKENFQKLLIGSGILQEDNESIKARIVTPGEIGILPIFQKRFALNLPLKSHFVSTQLHETYIQLTLNQVVQIASSNKDASSIIIHDTTFQIENISDIISKNYWENTRLSDTQSVSHLHNKTCSAYCDNYSVQNYTKAMEELKQYVMETCSAANKFLNLDILKRINTCKTCGRSIQVSIRNIIERGLKPTLQDIAAIISSSVTNENLFGKYHVGYFFVMDNTFFTSKNSSLCSVFYNILQKSIEESTESRRLDSQTFVIQRPLRQLLQPNISKRCGIYDILINGSLSRASQDTYAIYAVPWQKHRYGNMGLHIHGEGYKYKEKNYVGEIGDAMIILRKGQLVPHIGLVRHFRCIYRGLNRRSKRRGHFFLELVRLHSEYNELNNIVNLHRHTYDILDENLIRSDSHATFPIFNFKISYDDYNSVLRFVFRKSGDDEERSFEVRQHITLINS